MSADLELDFVSLQSEIEKLDKAIKRFEPYSKGFIDSTLKNFEGFNSDLYFYLFITCYFSPNKIKL
ncbi:MAG TPA: hypothetical protein DCW90_17400 [Lachnospiraceae bacterium]|nr:hypothetical protein [uncultured Lachnoclostridium sp.]HAU87189.1 hypothetical protein [Lachnospiraceae bacterium]